jgi:hypothetical protein
MKHGISLLALLAAVFLAGCAETLNHAQYKLIGPASGESVRASAPAADQAALKEILSSIAAQFKLTEMSGASLMPNTIAYFTEIDASYPIQLNAYVVGDQVVVDLLHSHPYGGETAKYDQIKGLLLSELKSKFGNRVRVTPATTLRREKPKKAQ